MTRIAAFAGFESELDAGNTIAGFDRMLETEDGITEIAKMAVNAQKKKRAANEETIDIDDADVSIDDDDVISQFRFQHQTDAHTL